MNYGWLPVHRQGEASLVRDFLAASATHHHRCHRNRLHGLCRDVIGQLRPPLGGVRRHPQRPQQRPEVSGQ